MDISKFMISSTQYLKIDVESMDENYCPYCVDTDIDYIDEKNNIAIRFGYDKLVSIYHFMTKMDYIQKLIADKYVLDKEIIHDLGFEWNQFCEGLQTSDTCFKYHFFNNSHKQIRPYFNSWLYNDENGTVIFEITPFYPWHNKIRSNNPDFIPYKKFIKNYQPTVKVQVCKENLQQWIIQAEQLKKTIFLNEQINCCPNVFLINFKK